jgi:hypothetical protein
MKAERADDLQVLCRSCHDMVDELAALMNGESLNHISAPLSEILKRIDGRIAGSTPEMPELKRDTSFDGLSEEEGLRRLQAVVNKKQREQGLKVT